MEITISVLNFFAVFCLVLRTASARCPPSAVYGPLELVQIVYRHGDRAPLEVYPTDEHAEYWKTLGLGQLTNLGKEQQYELGQFIRQYYADFLNETYDKEEVVIRSTDMDRTLMSAEVNLAGLYPPIDNEVWNPNLNWQPIPVHTVPLPTDYLLSTADCPKYDQLNKEVMNSSEVQSINKEYKSRVQSRYVIGDEKCESVVMDFYEFLSNATGAHIRNIEDAGYIYGVLLCEQKHNLSKPAWLNDTIYDILEELERITFSYLFYTSDEQLLSGGSLVKEMIANAHNKAAGQIDKRKAFIYSAHDTTLTAVLSTLGVYDRLLVPYTATLFVELHRPPVTGDPYSIRILYRNETQPEPYELKVPNCAGTCGMPCALDTLARIVKPLMPDDIVAECRVSGNVPSIRNRRLV